jgi:hypothetical protein
MRHYLLPIADRAALKWIVREQQTAFGEHRAREAEALEGGDVLLLYTTRGCFRNPTRDRGRLIGRAIVESPVQRQERPVTFAGREYPLLVRLRIEVLAPLRTGVELAPLVPRLPATFPNPSSWSVRLRRALVPIEAADALLLERALSQETLPYEDAVGSYG